MSESTSNGSNTKITLRFYAVNSNHDGLWIWNENSGYNQFVEFITPQNTDGLKYCTISDLNLGDEIGFLFVNRLESDIIDWNKKNQEGQKDRFIKITEEYLEQSSEFETDYLKVYAMPSHLKEQILYGNQKIVKINYKRVNNDYNGCSIYVYGKKSSPGQIGEGVDFSFFNSKEHNDWCVATIPVEFFGHNPHKIWYKIHDLTWNKEFELQTNRSIMVQEFSDENELSTFIMQGHYKRVNQKPNIKSVIVNLYYKRYIDDYEGWQVSYYLVPFSNINYKPVYFNKSVDKNGWAKASFPIDFFATNKGSKIGISLSNPSINARDTFSFTRQVEINEDYIINGEINLYAVQGIFNIGLTQQEMQKFLDPSLVYAKFGNPGDSSDKYRTIYIGFNTPISKKISKKISITIKEKGNAITNTWPIEQISQTDNTNCNFKLEFDNLINKFTPLDNKYFVHIENEMFVEKSFPISIQNLYSLPDFEEKYTYNGNDLGCTFDSENNTASFKIWVPMADAVNLILYEKDDNGCESIQLQKADKGIWQTTENIIEARGKRYIFKIKRDGEEFSVLDPYVKFATKNAELGVIESLDDEEKETKNWNPPTFKDLIIYEGHVKDLTKSGKISELADFANHLRELGVNCFQIMPLTFFEDDGAYNWGYDQKGYHFLMADTYSSNINDPTSILKDFKKVIDTFHENGIAVIMDMVIPHTVNTEDSPFHKLFNFYYHRTDNYGKFTDGSYCINEIAIERSMCKKLVIDVLIYWLSLGVDGFRLDQMQLISLNDLKNIISSVRKVFPKAIIYGEGLTPKETTPLLPNEQATINNMINNNFALENNIGVFWDDWMHATRNCIKNLYSNCNIETQRNSLESFANFCPSEHNLACIKFFDIHDGMIMMDTFKLPGSGVARNDRIKIMKFLISILTTRRGPVAFYEGTEISHSRHCDPNPYKSEVNLINFGKEDNLIDFDKGVNLIDFDKGIEDKNKNLIEYISSWTKFRSSFSEYFNYSPIIKIIQDGNSFVISELFENKMIILTNFSRTDYVGKILKEVNFNWAIVLNNEEIGNKRIGEPVNKDSDIFIPAESVMVLVNNEIIERNMPNEKFYQSKRIMLEMPEEI